MTGESTASLALSFGLIAIAAIALYPRGHAGERASPSMPSKAGADEVPGALAESGRPPSPPADRAIARARAGPERAEQVSARSGPGEGAGRPGRPDSAFTTVAEGEDLAAVARRVYRTEDVLKSLWLANRDQVTRPDEAIPPGTLLRTPPL